MLFRSTLSLIAVVAMLTGLGVTGADAQTSDMTKYPDIRGPWNRIGPPRWTPSGEQPPLTQEYQAVHAANLADQAQGGQGTDPTYTCLSPGMPRIMNVYDLMEILVTPQSTHMLIEHIHDHRRIHTDGRIFSDDIEPSFRGYSIGQWVDEDGDGKYDVLVVETRHFKGPRSYDASGLPLHADNKTVIKERIYIDKADPDWLHDEITVIDNALTRPWTVHKKYRRHKAQFPVYREIVCTEHNNHVAVGKEAYMISADGFLMPVRKDQAPPDTRYFKQTQR